MATSGREFSGLQNVIRSYWTEDRMMEQLGYKRVEGLSFWVRANDLLWALTPHECNRPFTKAQHRAHVREQRKLRWKRRARGVGRRFRRAADALRGREEEAE